MLSSERWPVGGNSRAKIYATFGAHFRGPRRHIEAACRVMSTSWGRVPVGLTSIFGDSDPNRGVSKVCDF